MTREAATELALGACKMRQYQLQSYGIPEAEADYARLASEDEAKLEAAGFDKAGRKRLVAEWESIPGNVL